MILENIACILAMTTRSKAYVCEMIKEHIFPSHFLIMAEKEEEFTKEKEKREGENIYFNSAKTMMQLLENTGVSYEVLTTKDINDELMYQKISSLNQNYIIYSGYGGGILKSALFEMGKKFLHVHAGLLPQFRGSTTAYYSLLEQNQIGATAIFLEKEIDAGKVITSDVFMPPEDRTLIDYYYEPYVRSKVLIKALKLYAKLGEFPEVSQKEEAETYYIIHPVLKHIAIMMKEEER